MDRETARRNVTSGLIVAAIAAAVFGLAFLSASIYIAQ
jgi:hypothetical protein